MEAVAVYAPGRVNLIGEHTDYSGGFVLPAAISFGVAVRGASAETIRLRSLQLPGQVVLGPDGGSSGSLPDWGRYVAAVAELLALSGRAPIGLQATVDSSVPIGAGLSSSAALNVAVALALCRVAGFSLPPLELARLAQQAELRAVGVPCGLMDPASSLLGRRGCAVLLDCAQGEWRHVRLPARIAIVVLDSGTRHSLAESGYRDRRAELERALPALAGRRPAELTLPEALSLARAAGVDELAIRRLRHVVTENARVRDFVERIEAPTPALGALGSIMLASHESLRDDFEVSTPELDTLVELAYAHGAIGARLTGGGFGGSVVALAEREAAPNVAREVAAAFRERTGRQGNAWVCAAVDGAGDLEDAQC